MTQWKSTEEILDFAIANEQSAHTFYLELAEKVKHDPIRSTLLGFAAEELGHKTRLEAIRAGKAQGRWIESKVADLKISDYLADVVPSPEMSFQEALIVAMKQERAAFRLYSDLAEITDDEELARTFRLLAQEEARHKLRFELVYDDAILLEG